MYLPKSSWEGKVTAADSDMFEVEFSRIRMDVELIDAGSVKAIHAAMDKKYFFAMPKDNRDVDIKAGSPVKLEGAMDEGWILEVEFAPRRHWVKYINASKAKNRVGVKRN